MRKYLDLVVNPIDATQPAQVPDLTQFNSLCMTDYTDVHAPTNNTSGNCFGALIFITNNFSTAQQNYGSDKGLPYSVNVAPLSGAGQIILDDDSEWTTYKLANTDSIFGTGVSDSLIDQYRLIAAGLRVLPTIETVTDTTITYISYAMGGQLSMLEIGNAATNSLNIFAMVKSSPCAKSFSNNQGVSVRLDPFQAEEQLAMLPITYVGSSVKPYDNFKMPCVAVAFSQAVAAAAAMPIILHGQAWLEGVVRQPSPLYAQQSPVDTEWNKVRSIMSQCNDAYPLVASGHSFAAILAAAPLFIDSAIRILGSSSKLVSTISGVFKQKKGAKKRAKQNQQQIPRKQRRQRRQVGLPGRRAQQNARRNPRNSTR